MQFFTITVDSEDRERRSDDINFAGFQLETSNNIDGINGLLQLKNKGDFKENDVTITADIYDLRVHEVVTQNLNLGKRDTFWIPININLPQNTPGGEYLVNIKVSNKRHSEEQTLVVFVEGQ